MTASIPHDKNNPHHQRLVRISEKPLRTSDGQGRISDISSLLLITALFDEIDVNVMEEYVSELKIHSNEIETLGWTIMHSAALQVGGVKFMEKLRRLCLLSSPFSTDHYRIKTCAHHLNDYISRLSEDTDRPLDKRCEKVCEDLKLHTQLLR